MTSFLAHVGGTGIDDWALVAGPVAIFVVIAALLARPRGADRSPLASAAHALERVTKMPGWAAGAVGTGVGGLVVAMIGFYWDVAWHIDLGRDKELFTPPHTMILLGLGAIPLAGAIGAALASATGVDTKLRFRGIRLPWSSLALLAIGAGAVMGFPLDDMWHRAYGIDVTMWGPTHLIMIGGASITPIALWLVLGEARVRAEGTLARAVHGILAGASLIGLSALQGEFDFGVPQFQLLYHPVMVMIAASVALTAARIVLGRGGALRAVVGFLAIRGAMALLLVGFGHTVTHFPLYIAPAIAVEIAAMLVGTQRLGRFALAAGAGVVTLGLAGEWGWSHVWAKHPWPSVMLPETIALGLLAALAGAIVGAGLGAAITGRPAPEGSSRRLAAAAVAVAFCALAISLALPIKRVRSDVTATAKLQVAGQLAFVELTLTPANAADDARWFEAMSWQGGGLAVSQFSRVAPGVYRTEKPIPIGGKAKALVRFHRGAEMGAVPIRFPDDPEIGASSIPAEDRTAIFERDSKLLMREAHGGNPLTARFVFGVLSAIVVVWMTVLIACATRILPRRPEPALVPITRAA
jgi:hypothetical protein